MDYLDNVQCTEEAKARLLYKIYLDGKHGNYNFLKTKVHWDSAMSQVNQLVSGIHETWLPNPTFFAASRRIMMNSRRMEREENKSP